MIRSLLGVAGGVVLVGCVSTSATMLDTTVRPRALCPSGVKVYLNASEVPQGATQIALLSSEGDDDMTSEAGMIESQRKKAAEVGANGLVLGERRDASSGAKIASALLGTSQNRKGTAVAVFVPSDTARAYGACRTEAATQQPRTEEE